MSYSRICTWNIQTFNGKLNLIREFLHKYNIQILGHTDTNWKGQEIDVFFQDYQWFGQKSKNNTGGVGFLVHNSILVKKQFKIFRTSNSNSISLYLKPNSGRHTFLTLIYGNCNLTASRYAEQWDTSLTDLNKIKSELPKNLDSIFLGDFNARVGKPGSNLEETILGKFGEEIRNTSGKSAIEFLIEADLVCLNNRDKRFRESPQYMYTYHCVGNESAKSIIDLICVSRGMMCLIV